jgi:hypothetical protein
MRILSTVIVSGTLAVAALFLVRVLWSRRRRRDEAAHRMLEELERYESAGYLVGRAKPIQNARRGQKLWLRPADRRGPHRGAYQCWLAGGWLPAKAWIAVSGQLGYGPHTGDRQVLYIHQVHVVLTTDARSRARRHRRRGRRALVCSMLWCRLRATRS